ncbi:hypothetical protein ASPZODRAFT_15442 [Penicilliopsis zonata CBS 506.65]|uniref:Anaphase-promoting complex subunit 2 n=1 Tax=Penicilliopsis zonata CBS 506.65 TaxID=1073090 RepID=A0A1L9SLR8_9EURO|nr:hypothetical protein ASPZODRAFT_15442 [Penicilliopsis zonata CBS 506.65]OJJ47994.1 hypothetical protein ASPZODRAFT_15442 [Penicilliopsis zonata CBS 506.65]
MIQTVPIPASRRRVFDSVFSPASLDDFSPTPVATPALDYTAVGQPFGGGIQTYDRTSLPRPSTASSFLSNDTVPLADEVDKTTWDHAWQVATAFLVLPDAKLSYLEVCGEVDQERFFKQWNRHDPPSKETTEALAYLLGASSAGRQSSGITFERPDLLEWYGNETRRHFLKNFREGLLLLLRATEIGDALQKTVQYLHLARTIYLAPVVEHILPLLDTKAQEKSFGAFQEGFHAVVAYSLPWNTLSPLLAQEVTKEAFIILGIDTLATTDDDENDMEVDRQCTISYLEWREEPSDEVRMHMMAENDDAQVTAARDRLLSLFNGLQLVGLGGDRAQKVFASVMDALLTEFTREAYTGQWEGPSLVVHHLRQWIENVFARLVVQVLAIIHPPEQGSQASDRLSISLSTVERWQESGIARLGALRTGELFDVIVDWPASSGAIEDLRHFTTHPAARLYVTQTFITALNQRLLHPGASTVEILQVYISIIRGFTLLDPKGVLLDRIARPIRRYLRDRDDTIKAIVGGLLADPDEADEQVQPAAGSSADETLVELSAELAKAHRSSLQRADSGELDWDDMNWMPDPVDAAPDYRKSKSSDVIGSLISLFESKEAFVKEMQQMLADRLLRKRGDFEQELSVVEFLKVRFGDSALQACEVMLRDIFDSKRVDASVRNDQRLAQEPDPGVDQPELHAKILSRFFWPELQPLEFKVPEPVAVQQQQYAEGFESLKQSRKLTWHNGLGQVTVELDLEDRVFVDQVTTWQATVIYAFQSSSSALAVEDLSQELAMSAALVRSACLFWVSKRILTEVQRDHFCVLEVLPSETDENAATGGSHPVDAGQDSEEADRSAATANAAAAADAAAAAAAKETADAAAMEKMNLYWQFIMGMLTNQGAMPLQRIVMMLKIAVPGGFPFSNEELREFLAGMVNKGKLEIVSGGNYKIIRDA